MTLHLKESASTLSGNSRRFIRLLAAGMATVFAGVSMAVAQVTPSDQTITMADLPPKTYGDDPFTVTATASSGLPITTWESSDPAVATISTSGLVTIVGAGQTSIIASNTGNTNYNAAWIAKPLNVARSAAPLPSGTRTVTYNGSAQGLNASALPAGLATETTYRNTSTPEAPATPQVVFQNGPDMLAASYASTSLQAVGIWGQAKHADLGGAARKLHSCDVTLVTWAGYYGGKNNDPVYRFKDWADAHPTLVVPPTPGVSIPGEDSGGYPIPGNSGGWYHPVTLAFYDYDTVGGTESYRLLTSKTVDAFIPWRPEKLADGVTDFATNGYAFRVPFDFPDGVILPDQVWVAVSFNTQSSGVAPIGALPGGVNAPYNSLNIPSPDGQQAGVTLSATKHFYFDDWRWQQVIQTRGPMLRLRTVPTNATLEPPVNAGIYELKTQAAAFWEDGISTSTLIINNPVTQLTLLTTVTPAGSGMIAGAGNYARNATATLTAAPNTGYIFTGWTGDASGTDNPLSILMDSDKTIGATFTRIPPTISAISDVTIEEDGSTGALAFAISDLITPASSLSVAGSSNNLGLVPNGNIEFGGSGASRTVMVTPLANQTGSSLITVTVGNGEATATETFIVTVTAVNDAPTISTVSDTTIDEDTSTNALAFTVGDLETTTGSLDVTAQSSNTTLVPTANVVIGGSGSQRTVTVTPAANQSGSANIILSVSDGSDSTSTSFVLTVNPMNDAPTISGIADLTINSGTSSGAIGFTIGDLETDAGALTVTALSGNTILVPNSGTITGGSGASRTVTVTPVATQTGAAIITISVSDGLLTSSESFVLNVHETPFGQDFVWAKGFGGGNSDTAYSIATDSFGNAMVAVDFTGTVPFGTFSLTAAGSSSDLALLKVASDGNVLSATRFGGANTDYAKAVAVDASNNVILAGEFLTSTLIGGVTHPSAGSKDISLLKVNSAGTLQWSKRFGGTLSDSLYGLATDADGNIFLAGDFSGTITFGATTLTSSGGRDGFVAKLDPTGTPLWAMNVGGTGNDAAYAVTVSPSGQILVGGAFSLTANFGTISRTSAGGTDGFAMGISTAGSVQWATRFGGSANDSARAVAVDVAGAACFAGNFAGTDASFGTEILASEGLDDVFVTRLAAADGGFLNVKQCGGAGADAGLGLAADSYGSLYLSGSYSGTAYFDGNTLVTPQGPDVFVAKLSIDDNFLWALEGSGSANDSATSVAANQVGHVFVAGLFAQSARIGSHEVAGGGLVDLFVARINGPTPSFVSTPGPVTVDVGDPFSIAAPAVGAGPITYQWFKGAVPLAGQTSATLEISAAAISDQGVYHVVATNIYGATQLPDVIVTVRVPDRMLTLDSPATSSENRTLEVPLYLDSDGEVTGLTVEMAYDRDLLRNPSFDVGKDLSKQNTTVVVDTVAGTVRVVGTAFPSSIPAGRKLVGTFSFTTRSVPENAHVNFAITLASISDVFGAPLDGYTKLVGDQTPISRRSIPGDANNNGRLEVSDAAELIRLYANPSQIRTWDHYLNDLNLDGVLTEGDATRVLRVKTRRDDVPSFPEAMPAPESAPVPMGIAGNEDHAVQDGSNGKSLKKPNSQEPIPMSDPPVTTARLVLTRLTGANANKVLVQVILDDVPIGQAGASFQVDYPASVLKITGSSSLIIPFGGLPSGTVPQWNVMPGNDYANQTGSVSCAAAWGSAWDFINGQAVANIVFEINPAAIGQVHFPLTLSDVETGPHDTQGPANPLAVPGHVVTFSLTYADWALANLGNAFADPNVDSDGDGMSNGAEFAASTNPGDAGSRLETTSAVHTPEGFKIRWHAAYGVNYLVRWSGDLVTWDDLVSSYSGSGAEAEVTDSDAPAGGRFYRVEVIESP